VLRGALLLILISWGTIYAAAASGGEAALRFRLDAAESRVWFDADARLHRFRGETQQLTGYFTLQRLSPPQLIDASVSIDAASLSTGQPERDADMHRDFLEVDRFPTIEFHADHLLMPPAAPQVGSWDVILQGRLTVHGVSRGVNVPTIVRLDDARISARGQVHLDMRDYRIRVPRLLLIPMKSEVLVGFEVVAQPVN
jgi:polyisoprenoid-binding protein YceI